VLARKKAKKKPQQQNLGAKQIAQLQKNSSREIVQDFTFHWPLELHHFWLSSLFGARKKANGTPGFHYGIDMAAMKGTPVKSAAAGTVIQAQYVPGYGNNVLIQHNKYYRTRYAHLNRIHATVGQKVTQGQKIGTVGDTGSVRKSGRDASHLHFEIYHNGSHVNPLRYLFS
jgi:murein DD-endopeptidase MepM/ murein hydrolase activator NlpD